MADIDWPPRHRPRTDPGDRERCTKFEATINNTVDDLNDEFKRLGALDWRLETAAEHQSIDPNRPYAGSDPDDPGAVVYWTMGPSDNGGEPQDYAVSCDHWTELRDNLRSLYHHIKEKRMLDSRPVNTAESEFANAALPAGDEEDGLDISPEAELGVGKDADHEEIKRAVRRRLKEAHPDNGGSPEELQRVQRARDELLG